MRYLYRLVIIITLFCVCNNLYAQTDSLIIKEKEIIHEVIDHIVANDSSYVNSMPDTITTDTLPPIKIVPLDTIIAHRIDSIMLSLPKYKFNKFSRTLLRMPLMLADNSRSNNLSHTSINTNTTQLIQLSSDKNNSPELTDKTKRMCDNYLTYSTLRYDYMIKHPNKDVVLVWNLPEFKKLEDVKLKEITELPFVAEPEVPIQMIEIKKTHWLHTLDGSIQFSQAYLSPNWYQGGNNNLSLLLNFLWNVKLNEVHHPSLLFESNVQYKLGLYSTPQDECHDYSISEDLFQWNLKAGVKAFKKWFYSFTSQFKTQLLNTYPQNSMTRIASFMSPADLNLGLGMTYNTTNKSKSLKFNVSIAPISYNLKTCLDTSIDPTQFNIALGKKMTSEIGSNAELTFDWNITKNINYRSRLFAFSNYKYFLSDWENTFSFSINKFLSTQIYVHLRYDSSSELNDKWRHWMLKEILSFGFQYKFATKI